MMGSPQVRNSLRCFEVRIFIIVIFVVSVFLSSGSVVSAAGPGLIESHVLSKNLSDWVILDARPKADWMAGHIPGAISFSWEDYTRTDNKGVPCRAWPPQELAAELGKMGIDENSRIVVYGDADKSWGGEGWDCWVLAWLGHKGPIRLLAGGIRSWLDNNYPIKKGLEKTSVRHVQYKFKIEPGLDISTADIKKEKSNLALVDTRSTLEWFKGRIPGAVHINWEGFYTGKDRHPLAPGELKNLLQKHGVDLRKPVVYYCTGGIRSGYAWLVHQLAGLPTARNYEGGFEAWKRLSSE
jgi:thiosulfate/3-mercaptopyruvate sulfurtransferase